MTCARLTPNDTSTDHSILTSRLTNIRGPPETNERYADSSLTNLMSAGVRKPCHSCCPFTACVTCNNQTAGSIYIYIYMDYHSLYYWQGSLHILALLSNFMLQSTLTILSPASWLPLIRYCCPRQNTGTSAGI